MKKGVEVLSAFEDGEDQRARGLADLRQRQAVEHMSVHQPLGGASFSHCGEQLHEHVLRNGPRDAGHLVVPVSLKGLDLELDVGLDARDEADLRELGELDPIGPVKVDHIAQEVSGPKGQLHAPWLDREEPMVGLHLPHRVVAAGKDHILLPQSPH